MTLNQFFELDEMEQAEFVREVKLVKTRWESGVYPFILGKKIGVEFNLTPWGRRSLRTNKRAHAATWAFYLLLSFH